MKFFAVMLGGLLSLSLQAHAGTATAEQLDSFLAATGMTNISQNDKNILMQNLTPDDIDHYVGFLKTDAGKSYLDFNKKIAPLLGLSMKAIMGGQGSAAAAPAISPEQSKNYEQMLSESMVFQTFKYAQTSETNGRAAAYIMMAPMITASILRNYPDQLADVYKDYAPNAEAFDAFNKSQAAHDVIAATLKIAQQKVKDRQAALAH